MAFPLLSGGGVAMILLVGNICLLHLQRDFSDLQTETRCFSWFFVCEDLTCWNAPEVFIPDRLPFIESVEMGSCGPFSEDVPYSFSSWAASLLKGRCIHPPQAPEPHISSPRNVQSAHKTTVAAPAKDSVTRVIQSAASTSSHTPRPVVTDDANT